MRYLNIMASLCRLSASKQTSLNAEEATDRDTWHLHREALSQFPICEAFQIESVSGERKNRILFRFIGTTLTQYSYFISLGWYHQNEAVDVYGRRQALCVTKAQPYRSQRARTKVVTARKANSDASAVEQKPKRNRYSPITRCVFIQVLPISAGFICPHETAYGRYYLAITAP